MRSPFDDIFNIPNSPQRNSEVVIGESVKFDAVSGDMFMQFAHDMFGGADAPFLFALGATKTIIAVVRTTAAGDGSGFWDDVFVVQSNSRAIIGLTAPGWSVQISFQYRRTKGIFSQ